MRELTLKEVETVAKEAGAYAQSIGLASSVALCPLVGGYRSFQSDLQTYYDGPDRRIGTQFGIFNAG